MDIQEESYYDILGVSNDVTAEELTKNFRRLALKHHPDKSKGDDEKFRMIAKAYKVLSDPETRQAYDTSGALPEPFDWDDVDQLFRQFGMTTAFEANQRRGKDVKEIVEVTLEDIYVGVTKRATSRKYVLCDQCKENVPTCVTCNGYGEYGLDEKCKECSGLGYKDNSQGECKNCRGTKTLPVICNYSVEIKPGTYNGQHIPFEGEGDEEPGALPGDRVFVVKTLDHPLYQRVNFLDLATDVVITSAQKHTKGGHDVKLITLDGSEMNIHLPEGIANGRTLEVDNAGLPDYFIPSKRGKLLVKIRKVKNLNDRSLTPAQEPEQNEPLKRSGSFKRFDFMRNSFRMSKNKKENRKSMPEFRSKELEKQLDSGSMTAETRSVNDEMVDIDFTENVIEPKVPDPSPVITGEKRWPYNPHMRETDKYAKRRPSFFRLSFRKKSQKYAVTSTPTKDEPDIAVPLKLAKEKPPRKAPRQATPPPPPSPTPVLPYDAPMTQSKPRRRGILTSFFFK